MLLDPQPPTTDPAWAGNTVGAVYQCYVPAGYLPGTGFGISNVFWSAAPPDAVTLTPQQAAEIVVAAMDLRAIDIGIVPEPGVGSVGLVGLPVWMWTDQSPNTWGPLSRTASAGGVSITATASVRQVVWDMGDGTAVTCSTAGTVYEDRYADQMSPDCGHQYSQASVGRPGNAYSVSATSYWQVDWTGGGAAVRSLLNSSLRHRYRLASSRCWSAGRSRTTNRSATIRRGIEPRPECRTHDTPNLVESP